MVAAEIRVILPQRCCALRDRIFVLGHNVGSLFNRSEMVQYLCLPAALLTALTVGSLSAQVIPTDANQLLALDAAGEAAEPRRSPGGPSAIGGVRYGRDIRPILSDRCFRCHGPDANQRAAGLRLDAREFAIAKRDGAAAIVPGDPSSSLLIERIKSHDLDERMPPPDSNKPALQDVEIALFEEWIRDGAIYEDHWAFSVPKRPTVPQSDSAHPIDGFIKQAHELRGITANPSADLSVLARRLFLVLTGLPPTPEELDAWLADQKPGAYERLVDRLLSEEPYATRHAEHLASIWLDAGRYADTSGIHMDAGRQGWLWRDWLIDSIRKDKPFDQFVGSLTKLDSPNPYQF